MAGIDEDRADPGRDLEVRVVVDRAELLQRPPRVVDRVERLVEVEVDVRRLAPEVVLVVDGDALGDPGTEAGADVGGHRGLLGGRLGGDRRRVGRGWWPSIRWRVGGTGVPASAPGALPSSASRIAASYAASSFCVVEDGLVRVLPLPACFALRELLLEVARVEQHELGQLAGRSGRDRSVR